ncbi:hypothetical protein ACNQKP_10895 [Bdellovibrio bacteriovorus]|uniref:hypothetical protein n=1 Tax=Bdellovibrio bacteriovorus TaxID=959 RepID=UPI003AA96859
MRYRSLFFVLFFGNVAWAGLTADQVKKIRMSIDSNDSKSVTDTLAGIEDPFRCPKKGLGKIFDNTPSHYCKADSEGQELLKSAFKARPCLDEIIVELLKSGARYDFGGRYSNETILKDAYEAVCPKVIDHMITVASEDEVASAASKFFVYAARKASLYIETLKDGYEVDTEGIEALKPISKSLREFVMDKCPDISKATPVCSARESLEAAKAKTDGSIKDAEKYAQEEQAREDFANSPEGMKAAICEIDRQIAEAQAEIDRQKKIGKVSGTVNMLVLNQAGTKIVDLREARKLTEKNLKLKIGKDDVSWRCK